MASKESERVNRYWETIKQPPQPDSLVSTAYGWDVLTGEPGGVDYLEIDAGGVPALWEIPHGVGEDSPVLLCFHGGGYVSGSMFTHRKMFAHLAKAIGARALVIDYTLLPDGGRHLPRTDRRRGHRVPLATQPRNYRRPYRVRRRLRRRWPGHDRPTARARRRAAAARGSDADIAMERPGGHR
jgi:alpha/beta hydrolase fold